MPSPTSGQIDIYLPCFRREAFQRFSEENGHMAALVEAEYLVTLTVLRTRIEWIGLDHGLLEARAEPPD